MRPSVTIALLFDFKILKKDVRTLYFSTFFENNIEKMSFRK